MAFEDYKNLDLTPEKKDEKELEELRKQYGVETESTPRFVKEVNAEE